MNRASQTALVLIGILLTLLTACATRDKGYVVSGRKRVFLGMGVDEGLLKRACRG